MNPTHHHSDEHDDIVLLLPWYVNQTLEPAELARVKTHVRGCLECRRELQVLGQIEQALQQPDDPLDLAAHASFRQLQERIAPAAGTQPANVVPLPAKSAKKPGRLGKLTSLALAASLLLLAAPLALRHVGQDQPLDYQTLSNRSAPEQGHVRVVFAPNLPFAEADQLLRSIGGQMVSGPNSAGAYTVRIDAAKPDPDATAEFLRQRPGVLLAEPVLQAAVGE